MKVKKKTLKSKAKADGGDDSKAADAASEAGEDTALSSAAQGWKGFCKAFATIMGKEVEVLAGSPIMCQTEVAAKIKERKAKFKEQKKNQPQKEGLERQGLHDS